jgi:hypothetical protein
LKQHRARAAPLRRADLAFTQDRLSSGAVAHRAQVSRCLFAFRTSALRSISARNRGAYAPKSTGFAQCQVDAVSAEQRVMSCLERQHAVEAQTVGAAPDHDVTVGERYT